MMRDQAAALLAKNAILQHIRRNPDRIVRAGPISLWLRGGYSLDRTEEILQGLVHEGVLRPATPGELKKLDMREGYMLTEEGYASLPPEDRSYGVL